ncbi:MAG: tetratricopeptide repeat protein [Candidatus Omnitrophota bacterium]
MKKIGIILLFISYLAGFNCFAQENQPLESVFSKANKFYEQTEYDKAITEYENIIDRGLESGNIYYNLGNCYLKQGQLGKAILNYERANRLIPRDRGLQSNYKYAKSLIKGPGGEPKEIWVIRLKNSFFNQWTVDGIALLLFYLYISLILLMALGIIFKVSKVKITYILIVLGLFLSVSAVSLFERIAFLKTQAVVIQEKVEAKFEPLDKAVTHFSLYEGIKVSIISSKSQWYKVRRADKKSGWIQASALEKI